MKNKIIILVLTTMCNIANSQDLIIKKNGDEIKSKVVEIDELKIKYRKYENLSGPVYSVNSSEVFMIKYENGSKDVLNTIEPVTQKNELTPKLTEIEKKDVDKPNKTQAPKVNLKTLKTKHFGISFGLGSSYNTNIGLNLRYLLGNENWALVPNIGFGFIQHDEHIPKISWGLRLQNNGYYIGYNYGYVGKEEDYWFDEEYERAGSTLSIGKEVYLDEEDSFGVHSSFGINLDGYDLAGLSIFTFDLGILYRF